MALAGCIFAVGAAGHADEITLRVKGGDLEVKGELRSFDGVRYVIEAPTYGAMTFDASRVDCIGEACAKRVTPPTPIERLDPATPDTVAIRAVGPVGLDLLPVLINGYARSLGASVSQIVSPSTDEMRLRLDDAKGATLATYVVRQSAADAQGLWDGAAIVVSDRPLSEDASPRARAAAPASGGPSRQETIISQDGLAVVVSPDSPLVSISEDKLAKVFAGRISTWYELGVSGGRINLYVVDPASSGVDVLSQGLLKSRGLALSDTATRVASESALADAVTRDPGGIGVTSFATQRNAKRLNIEGSCGLITRPTSFAVKAGEYPLVRRLYVSTGGGELAPAARGLVRFASSAEAQRVLAEAQFVDQSVEQIALDDQKGRMGFAISAPAHAYDPGAMRELLAAIKGYRRLSITFRFAGGPDLDTRSRREVAHLADVLAGPEYVGKRVLLLGFTDMEGKFGPNQAASSKRAASVRTAVLAAAAGRVDPATITAKGYGPLAPVACADTPDRRALNRRVEVWVAE
jgi:phosphate transport system substrate-binding protein